ncbi:MAG: EamA family transporter [Acidobacteria bacterium]|nr:EamA family transporter [Acidobacteriota bacterium]
MTQPSRISLAAAFAAVYLIWGSTYLAIRWGVAEIPPFLMAGVRFLVAGTVFVALALRWGAARPPAYYWLTTGIIGVLMATGGNGLVSWSLQRIPSGLGALLVGMVPFWVALADWLRPRGTRPPAQVILGLVIGFTGVALLVNPSDIGGERSVDVVGAGAVIVASLLWAAGSVYSRYAPQPSSHWLSAGMQMLGGGAVLMAISVLSGESAKLDWSAVSHTAFGAWIYVAAFGSVAYGSYLWLLKASTPAKAATYAYVNPVIALILGYLLADETLTLWSFGCSTVVVIGVLLVVSR